MHAPVVQIEGTCNKGQTINMLETISMGKSVSVLLSVVGAARAIARVAIRAGRC